MRRCSHEAGGRGMACKFGELGTSGYESRAQGRKTRLETDFILLPPELTPAEWCKPYLSYLAVRDLGDTVVSGVSETWKEWELPIAGACDHREILIQYRDLAAQCPDVLSLGRSGTN